MYAAENNSYPPGYARRPDAKRHGPFTFREWTGAARTRSAPDGNGCSTNTPPPQVGIVFPSACDVVRMTSIDQRFDDGIDTRDFRQQSANIC